MATKISPNLQLTILSRLQAIKEQVAQKEGYPYDPQKLFQLLGKAVYGRFGEVEKWDEENGVIYFEVTSDGTAGPEWIKRLKKQGLSIGILSEEALKSSQFKSTKNCTYQIAVLKAELFRNGRRFSKTILGSARRRKLKRPSAEVACLICEKFSEADLKKMGMDVIVVFHEPLLDPGIILGIECRDWLLAYSSALDNGWCARTGFAFVVSKTEC